MDSYILYATFPPFLLLRDQQQPLLLCSAPEREAWSHPRDPTHGPESTYTEVIIVFHKLVLNKFHMTLLLS